MSGAATAQRPPRPTPVKAASAERRAPNTVITTTLGQLVTAEPVLTRLLTIRGLASMTAYRVAKLTQLVAAETPIFHAQVRTVIVEHGTERVTTPEEAAQYGPTIIEVKPEHRAVVLAKQTDLAAIPVTIAWAPLPFENLASADLTAGEILALGPLLAEPTTGATP